ncbi:MAG: hypothetical protein J7M21_02245, partial [Planctomycetes bacterium]|nr:hypothetical protein [Planctomycetota bacterium]
MSTKDDISRDFSAYLDGELSEADARAVEQAVRDDPALARRLDELAAVRGLLRAIPREPAPKDLAAGVMARAERLRLVGADEHPAPAGVLRWVRYLAGAAVLLVAAAVGLVVAVTLWAPPRPQFGRTARPESTAVAKAPALSQPAPTTNTPTARPAGKALGAGGGETVIAARPPGPPAGTAHVLGAIDADKPRLRASTSRPVISKALADRPAVAGKGPPSVAAPARPAKVSTASTISGLSSEVIYTDRLDATRKRIEELLVLNGIGPAGRERAVRGKAGVAMVPSAQATTLANVFKEVRPAPGQVQY